MPTFLYFVIGALVFGTVLFYAISQIRKFGPFLKIYDDDSQAPVEPDDDRPWQKHNIVREKPKHPRKVMTYSLIKFCAVIFLFVLLTSFGSYMILFMLFAWAFTLFFMYHYIKLWKYQGYSVALLILIFLAVIVVAAVLSPFIRDGILIVMKMISG